MPHDVADHLPGSFPSHSICYKQSTCNRHWREANRCFCPLAAATGSRWRRSCSMPFALCQRLICPLSANCVTASAAHVEKRAVHDKTWANLHRTGIPTPPARHPDADSRRQRDLPGIGGIRPKGDGDLPLFLLDSKRFFVAALLRMTEIRECKETCEFCHVLWEQRASSGSDVRMLLALGTAYTMHPPNISKRTPRISTTVCL